jgi:hypothetical protein
MLWSSEQAGGDQNLYHYDAYEPTMEGYAFPGGAPAFVGLFRLRTRPTRAMDDYIITATTVLYDTQDYNRRCDWINDKNTDTDKYGDPWPDVRMAVR